MIYFFIILGLLYLGLMGLLKAAEKMQVATLKRLTKEGEELQKVLDVVEKPKKNNEQTKENIIKNMWIDTECKLHKEVGTLVINLYNNNGELEELNLKREVLKWNG